MPGLEDTPAGGLFRCIQHFRNFAERQSFLGPEHEGGDYLCDASAETAARLGRFGVTATIWDGPVPDGAVAIAYPRIALFGGKASAYPYFGYYAIALARLGFGFELVDGAAIAAGALHRSDLLILPGGFAIWGLDQSEGVSGADAQIRAFLAAALNGLNTKRETRKRIKETP